MSWAIMLTAFGLLFILARRKKGVPWWLKAGVTFIAGASLAETAIGVWLAARVSDVVSIIPANPAYIIGGITLILLVLTVYDIGVDRKADKTALICLTILPVLFLAGIGPLAETGAGLTQAVSDVARNSLGTLIGG